MRARCPGCESSKHWRMRRDLWRWAQGRKLRPEPAPGQSRQLLGVRRARGQRLNQGAQPPRTSVATAASLTPASSTTLCRQLTSRVRSWRSDFRWRVRSGSSRIGVLAATVQGAESPDVRFFADSRYQSRPTCRDRWRVAMLRRR